MRKLTLALSTAALVMSGAAFAQTAPAPRAPKPDMTRAAAQARAEAMFARMDTNRDGKLDEADGAATKAQAFDRLDTDRNGSISQAELASRHDGDRAGKRRMARPAGAAAPTEAQKVERRAEMFARVDADKNGSLSRAEFEAMHAARGDRAGKKGGDRMAAGPQHVGPGGRHGMMAGGATTRQAFVDRALATFDRTDTNRDGTVTQAERQAARETMREQWRAKRQQQG